jgi:hypothetical protein
VKVQALGRLQILTRVSYLALIIVPILAGAWLAVQVGIQQYRHSLATAARDFDRSAERLETALRSATEKGTVPKSEEAAKAVDQLRRRAQEWNATYGPEKIQPRMPIGWALAFLAALGVTLGHLCYQTTCPELIRDKTSDGFRAEQNAAFIQCSEGQHRDKLFAVFPWFRQLALMVPRRYHTDFARRHDQTIWIPSSMERLDKVQDEPKTQPAEATHEESAPEAGNADPAEVKALPKFSKRELELILIDEGARAEYAVQARKKYGWACVSGALYGGAAFFIVWLIATQCVVVLKAAGWIS